MVSQLLRPTLALLALGFIGCETTPPKSVQAPGARNEGYALLHDLVSKQKGVSKLLIIKREQPDVRELVQEIARVTGDAEKQLSEFAKDDATLNLKAKPLPAVEQRTREAIDSTQTKQLLLSSGAEFELRLLLSQAEGLSYGSHLAKALHEQEADIRRKAFLESFSRNALRLHEQVFDLLSRRMRSK